MTDWISLVLDVTVLTWFAGLTVELYALRDPKDEKKLTLLGVRCASG
jgi:hypothetical protein